MPKATGGECPGFLGMATNAGDESMAFDRLASDDGMEHARFAVARTGPTKRRVARPGFLRDG
jgi:hypothetical protein